MGYTTEFDGQVTVEPPLNASEIAYLRKFAENRRMDRDRGPYYLGTGLFGQDREPDIRDYHRPPAGQPSLWCQWTPTDDGTAIEWDGNEKFYASLEWMGYLINTFLKPGATLASELENPAPGRVYPEEFHQFTFNHVLNGVIHAQGEDLHDQWQLIVRANRPYRYAAVDA